MTMFSPFKPNPPKTVLVISPAGRIYNHDNVQWYDEPVEKIAANYFNIGDMVVYDSTLKMLDYKSASEMKIISPTDADIEWYKTADYAIVRASNFIHNKMVWHRAVEVLERTQLPVYALGVGGQAPSRDDYKLVGDNLRFWKMVSERSRVVGVRGSFTADLLYSNGIKNIEVVGCPSIFRARNRDLKIETPSNIKRVAFSIRREVDKDYANNPGDYLRVQRQFLLRTSQQFDTTVTTHGEVEEKAFYFKNEEAIQKAREIFAHEGWFTTESAFEMERLYREKMFFFLRVEDYDAFIKLQDFAIGYRVHGVLPALANGIPGFLVKYDSRSTELADSLAIPSLILRDKAPESVGDLLKEVSFDDFNKMFSVRYDKMKFILEANGLAHRL